VVPDDSDSFRRKRICRLLTLIKITRLDGTIIGFTTHDRNISIGGVTYQADGALTPSALQSTSSLATDNLDVTGILNSTDMTDADIEAIYHDEYWNPLCDTLPVGVDYIVFNNNVLDGPGRSAILLQQALGVTPDGRIGPVTREAIRNADGAALIAKLSNASRAFYISLHQPKFTKGWLNRVASVNKNALAMLPAGTG